MFASLRNSACSVYLLYVYAFFMYVVTLCITYCSTHRHDIGWGLFAVRRKVGVTHIVVVENLHAINKKNVISICTSPVTIFTYVKIVIIIYK